MREQCLDLAQRQQAGTAADTKRSTFGRRGEALKAALRANMLGLVAEGSIEEVVERQRYLKYDEIWKRAESHFSQKKRAAKAAAEGG